MMRSFLSTFDPMDPLGRSSTATDNSNDIATEATRSTEQASDVVAPQPSTNGTTDVVSSNASPSTSSTSIPTTVTAAPKPPPTLVGAEVNTAYGVGNVVEYRENDSMYVIQIVQEIPPAATKPTPTQTAIPTATAVGDGTGITAESAGNETTTTATEAVPSPATTTAVPTAPTKKVLATLYTQTIPEVKNDEKDSKDWNAAYEALEKMRKLNLEMECHEAGLKDIDYDDCKTCLLTRHELKQKAADPNNADATVPPSRFPRLQKFVDQTTNAETTRFPRFQKFWAETSNAATATTTTENADSSDTKKCERVVVLPRIQKLLDERQKATAKPCLVCASNCCSKHASTTFNKEGITLCLSCERFFELDFIVDCVSASDKSQRVKHVEQMIDLYDRCLILLQYSAQYIEPCAAALEKKKEEQNMIGLGSSGVGIVSGVLGVAAAATILTPAGPPLLIASLVFGGGATAVQTGTEAMNYFSEPNKLADRIIALHGMLQSLLRVTSTLRDAMLRDHIRTDAYLAEDSERTAMERVQEGVENNRAGYLAASNVGRSLTLGGAMTMETTAGVAGAEASLIAGRSATTLSRAGTAAARTVRFARFAGGALSAAVLVLEANAIQNTMKSIRDGNPCEKASAIRKIADELKVPEEEGGLPSTSSLDEECQAYLGALANRNYGPTTALGSMPATTGSSDNNVQEVAAVATMVEHDTTNSNDICQAGAVILSGEEEEILLDQQHQQQQRQVNRSLMGSSSLLERIQLHQQRQREEDTATQVNEVETSDTAEINLVV